MSGDRGLHGWLSTQQEQGPLVRMAQCQARLSPTLQNWRYPSKPPSHGHACKPGLCCQWCWWLASTLDGSNIHTSTCCPSVSPGGSTVLMDPFHLKLQTLRFTPTKLFRIAWSIFTKKKTRQFGFKLQSKRIPTNILSCYDLDLKIFNHQWIRPLLPLCSARCQH